MSPRCHNGTERSSGKQPDTCGRAPQLRGRRGSSSVFLCVILSALVTVCFAFIYSTMEYTTASRADALMNLSAGSLLSEFDRDVLEEYGLFFLRDSDRQLSSKLRSYLMYTFGNEKRVRVSGVKASAAPFAMTDPTPAKEQIIAYMKAGNLLKLKLRENSGPGSESSAESGSGSYAGSGTESNQGSDSSDSSPRISISDPGRALRHGPTITSLPSGQMPKEDFRAWMGSRADDLSEMSLDEFFAEGTDHYLLATYALNMFNSSTRAVNDEHFFYREIEYLLFGEQTDRMNLMEMKLTLVALRVPLNAAHIGTDPKKQKLVKSVGHPAAVAAAITTWATAESYNDANLLLNGYPVPLRKRPENWAITFQTAMDDIGDGDGMIRPKTMEGNTYDDYLRLMLMLKDEDKLTARILDLIQINMRKNVDGKFLISECCGGVRIGADVNRRNYSYDKIY